MSVLLHGMSGWRLRAAGIRGLQVAQIRNLTNASAGADIASIRPTLPGKRIYFYALPLTTKKTFLHCKYNDEIFPGGKKNLEEKIIAKFTQLWNNFAGSEASFNRKVVALINRFLSNIPWLETCLLSIPSQRFITRKLNEDTQYVTHDQILAENIQSDALQKFDFYYPARLTNPELIIQNFKPEFQSQHETHKKGILKDLLLLPLTIPFAIVPLIPNIPGFYLLYRIYCHIKVIASLKYLIILLKDGHFNFDRVDDLAEIYLSTTDNQVRANLMEELTYVSNHGPFQGEAADTDDVADRQEKLLLSEDVARELCKAFGDEESAPKLIFAIEQERRHLKERADALQQQTQHEKKH